MTISLYSGTPGSGKSLHAAKTIYETLRYKKLPVITNFQLNVEDLKHGDKWLYVSNADLKPHTLIDYAKANAQGKILENSILLVVDECQLLFNSRDWRDSGRMAWIEFLSQHRKYGYRIILIAQDDRMIDRQFRALLELEVKHYRMSNVGVSGKLFSLLYAGRVFVASTNYYGLKQHVSTELVLPRKKYTRLYDTFALFAPDGRGKGMGSLGKSIGAHSAKG